MSEMKRCKQCGVLKSADAFRSYTYSKRKGTEGRFRICRQCENINTTYRRLCAEQQRFWSIEDEHYSVPAASLGYFKTLQAEIKKIESLYALLEAHGYHTPMLKSTPGTKELVASSTDAYVESLSNFYGANLTEPTEPQVSTKPAAPALQPEEMDIPRDLQRWLEMDTQSFVLAGLTPDYLQETVYESLKAKYRPQIGTDPQTFLPIYDDTYKNVLNQILRLFDDYEDYYASNEESQSE